jgi:hypothetical protein
MDRVAQQVPVGYGGSDADDGWPPHQPGLANPEGGAVVMGPAQLRLQAPALQEQHHGWKPLIPPNTQAPTVDIPVATSITRPGALADWQEIGSNAVMFTVKMRTHQGQGFTCYVNPVDLSQHSSHMKAKLLRLVQAGQQPAQSPTAAPAAAAQPQAIEFVVPVNAPQEALLAVMRSLYSGSITLGPPTSSTC